MQTSPESPHPPRSPGFYLFRSHSSIPPPQSPTESDDKPSFLHDILPYLTRQIMRSVTSVVLPVILLPIHFGLLFLSVLTTVLAGVFLSWQAFMVYLDIGWNTAQQVYSDYAVGGRRVGRRRRDLLRRVVLEREEAVRGSEKPRIRERRGLTIA